MKNRILVSLIIIIVICTACKNESSSTPISETQLSRYLFVQFWVSISGIASNEKNERCEDFIYIDGPGYSYDSNMLRSSFAIDLTKSKGILGCRKGINYPVGSGIFSNLDPISAFPYTPDWADFCQVLTINNIDTSGMVFAKVKDTSVSLAVGEEWTDSLTDRSDPSCQRVTTYRLTNFGFIDSEQITMPKK